MKAALAGLALLALAACQTEDQIGGDPAPASFVCDEARYFAVNYGQQGETATVTLTFADGETALLLSEPSDQGNRYAWPSDGTNYVFVAEGQTATVYLKDGTQGGTETPLYTNCKLQ